MSIRRKLKTEAFSLIELLVVITIIAIFAGLLLAVISTRKGGAQRAVCLSNQRQLVTALMIYAQSDSKRSFGGTDARRKFYPFVDENWLRSYAHLPVAIFFCPATRNGADPEKGHRRFDDAYIDLRLLQRICG